MVKLKQIENVSVNVKRPDHEIRVEVRLDAIYMYEEVVPGSGGLPVYWWSRRYNNALGGIDSPVAGMEVILWRNNFRFISIVHHLQ